MKTENLTVEEMRNLIAFLNRTQLQGVEADTLVHLKTRLSGLIESAHRAELYAGRMMNDVERDSHIAANREVFEDRSGAVVEVKNEDERT